MSTTKQPTLYNKIKFSIEYLFSKYDQIRRNLQIWSHLLEKSIMENFIFCEVPDFASTLSLTNELMFLSYFWKNMEIV